MWKTSAVSERPMAAHSAAHLACAAAPVSSATCSQDAGMLLKQCTELLCKPYSVVLYSTIRMDGKLLSLQASSAPAPFGGENVAACMHSARMQGSLSTTVNSLCNARCKNPLCLYMTSGPSRDTGACRVLRRVVLVLQCAAAEKGPDAQAAQAVPLAERPQRSGQLPAACKGTGP